MKLLSHRRRPPRRWGPAGAVAIGALCVLLTGAQPALAGPADSTAQPAAASPAGGASSAAVPGSTQGLNPAPKPPPALTVPGTGEKKTPFASLKPTAPRALPGAENTRGLALEPAEATAAASKISKANPTSQFKNAHTTFGEGDPPYCDEAIGRSTRVDVAEDGTQFGTIQYLAEMGCNFYLDAVSSVAGIVDRSGGRYEGLLINVGTQCDFNFYYYCASSGGVQVNGQLYDGARRVEVIYELYMLAPEGLPWGACNPLTNLRYLLCEGLGTDLLHIVVGTGPFDTGLAAPVLGYAALGDSYSSGTGAPPYFGFPDCRRSTKSYSYLIQGIPSDGGSGPRVTLPNLVACHGAVIRDITNSQYPGVFPQTDALFTDRTRLVTMSIGGNDLGFANKLRACVTGDCSGAPLVTQGELDAQRTRLVALYKNIRSRMRPDGYLMILGYPQIFPASVSEYSDTTCPGVANTISAAELNGIRNGYVAADNMISNAVRDTGDPRVVYIDVLNAFNGHSICSSNPWSNGFQVGNLDLQESFHPNAKGHDEEATIVALEVFARNFSNF